MGMSTCCCCIPLRIGVIIIAVFSTIVYALGTASLFISKNHASASFPIQANQYTAVFWTLVAVYILYTLSSLIGVVGSITQRRRMVLFFSILNWIMVVLTLIASFAVWIILLVKKSDVETACEAAVSNSIAANDSPYHTPVSIPNQQGDIQNACQEAIRNATIIGGVLVFVGNALQFYFASAISAYAQRLKRNNQHQKLRDLDDFPSAKGMPAMAAPVY
ncbi:hypothetical protein BC943DRAFT_60854 [Umbelopsis sp. AD052]|nr:hypothetical protein BC943DRAFT_60854 [Umbelopsis sp. AD052]